MPEVHGDRDLLRSQIRDKYREVAVDPTRDFHFHTGRMLAAKLGYDADCGLAGSCTLRTLPTAGQFQKGPCGTSISGPVE